MIGAYAILCEGGEAYVGGSLNIKQRVANHKCGLRRGSHPNRRLQEAWGQRGPEAFSFVVLELVSADELVATEQKWMDLLRSERGLFNIAPFAASARGLTHGEGARASMSAKLKGRVFSPEALARMSLGQRGRVHSAETRAKMSASLSGELSPSAKITAAIVREIRGLSASGVSQRVIAETFGISPSSVSQIVNRQTWKSVQ